MRGFLVIGNKAVTAPFNLNDLPGAGGRMDILCRCISQAFFISHGVRMDVKVYLLMLGEPDPPKAIMIDSNEIRSMSPDERNIAGLLRKALTVNSETWKRTSPGIYIANKSFEDLMGDLSKEYDVFYLREDGIDISSHLDYGKPLFVLGDHLGVPEDIERELMRYSKGIISLSKTSLQADQCILITHHELDKLNETMQ